ncbi:alpha amylase, catalytic domain protein [Mycobacterium kansasii]|uniref:Alpha amylase, catalytic domain protein n=1 Tax=Mycobacterium kansasii TaxID=1768 RepID=A0A1V3WC60_MYCKA|nr:alpha amylase, catalytic domain protein [Mycobacterium kansasii]
MPAWFPKFHLGYPWHRGVDERRERSLPARSCAPSRRGQPCRRRCGRAPDAKDFGNAAALPADPTWFKHAVFYEVLVRAFNDSSADGSGDLRGLLDRLDYLQWLGIDCIWLPRSMTHRYVTAGTTSATSTRCCPTSVPSTILSPWSMPPTAAESGSSPTW